MTQQHQYSEIERALSAFVEPGQVFEVRLLHKTNQKRTDSGYFDHPAHAATAIAALEEPYAGIYWTLNPVVADLAARSYNRISPWAKLTTMDTHILERHWLPIDVDPDRVPGISSTDEQLANSFKVANTIANMLEFEGWPRPYINVSGNGCHVLYPMKEPNTEGARDAIQVFLKTLHGRFKSDGCSIDTGNFNASRIFRIPGTWARKGDSLPLRPHRKAYIVSTPEIKTNVTLNQITTFNKANNRYLPTNTKVASAVKNEYPDDERRYRGLNNHAMERVKEWVPVFFPAAREYKEGFRVTSADLGLDHEEDLTIHPWPLGIKYFGVSDQGDAREGRRTPVSLLTEFVFSGDKIKAARALSDTLKVPLSEFDILSPGGPSGLDPGSGIAKLPGTTVTAPQYDFRKVPTMAELQKRSFKDQKWLIKDVLPTGNILLAARPKMRKTFLALQLAIAVCGGGKFLDWRVEQGDVLFLGLEDNERRLKSRIALMQTLDLNPPDLSGFRYWTGGVDISPTTGRAFVSNPEEASRAYAAFPRGEAGVEAIDRFLDMYPATRLIVIDTYAHFRDASNNRDVYQRDVDQMMPITKMASRREVTVLVVHHEKKGLASAESGDFLEDVSGTSGITGAVDGVMSIKGKRGVQAENEERKLYLSGRDIPHDFDVDMNFDAQRGGWLPAARQDVRYSILKLLERHPYMAQQEFCSILPNVSRSRISQVLTTMKFEGLITQGRAGYSLPNNFKGDF